MSFYSEEELKRIPFKSLGKAVKLSKHASIYNPQNISIGDYSRVDDFCVLSAGMGGIQLGRYVHLAVYCSLMGAAKIQMDDFSGLSSRVSIYSSSDDFSGLTLTNPTVPDEFRKVITKEVLLQKHAIVGSGTIILPGVTIGEGAAVGALAMVTKNCEAFGVYAGAPAKKIKQRSRDLLMIEKKLLSERTDRP